MNLTEACATKNASFRAGRIAEILGGHRRLLPSDTQSPAPMDPCMENLIFELESKISNSEAIEFVLPGFPCKSSSQWKVLDRWPDKAEEISLRFLDGLCRQIRDITHGEVKITICSDGRVFSPHIRVPDEHILDYGRELKQMIEDNGLTNLDIFQLEDCMSGSPNQLRAEVLHNFGRTIEEIREETTADPSLHNTRLGLTRFMLEEGKAWRERTGSSETNGQLQKDAKERAWRVLQASQAWGALVASMFPDSLRLSIHPQTTDSRKLGLFLIPTNDSFLTPWHGVAVENCGQFGLMRAKDLDRLEGRIVCERGRPSHFVCESPDKPK